MTTRTRVAFANGILITLGLVVTLATVWYFAGTGRQVTPAAAAPKPTQAGARMAADAFVGAVKAADANGICMLLSSELRRAHPNCTKWANDFIGLTTNGEYLVLAVVMQQQGRARVRMMIDGDHYFWFFRHQSGGWRFVNATAVPSA